MVVILLDPDFPKRVPFPQGPGPRVLPLVNLQFRKEFESFVRYEILPLCSMLLSSLSSYRRLILSLLLSISLYSLHHSLFSSLQRMNSCRK